eukprot:13908601-Alexandrium_andersonii.AAC.1
MQEVAAACTDDGAGSNLTHELAGLGSAGQHTSNIERDFWRHARKHDLAIDVPFAHVPLPMESSTAPGVVVKDFPLMLPHELIHSLFLRWPRFQTALCGNAGDLEAFWANAAREP